MDKLTGLLTRRDLDKRKQMRKSILLVNIKDLMIINDSHGHVVGNTVIKKVANIIADIANKNEEVFRYGGNLFLIQSNDINNLENTINIAIKDFKFSEDIDIEVDFGRANYNPFEKFDNLFENADKDLYFNKSNRIK